MLRLHPIFLLLLALAVPAAATPKRPDLKKLLALPQTKSSPYVPARAGWDGPEQNPRSVVYLQQLTALDSAQANRATLFNILIPDWRVVLLLLAAILMLRSVKRTTPGTPQASHLELPGDISRAA